LTILHPPGSIGPNASISVPNFNKIGQCDAELWTIQQIFPASFSVGRGDILLAILHRRVSNLERKETNHRHSPAVHVLDFRDAASFQSQNESKFIGIENRGHIYNFFYPTCKY